MSDSSEHIKQMVHDISIEAAKLSLARDGQGEGTDPTKIASALLGKYSIARKHLMATAAPILKFLEEE